MTIQEMHIAVNLGVQKIASFQVDNLLPQEIDHELNTAMDRFIKQRYSPMGNKYRDGFEQSQKRIDDLRSLVVDHRVQTEYKGKSVGDFSIDRARLPNDYMFLINVMSEMYYGCPTYANTQIIETNKHYFTVDITPPSENVDQFIAVYLIDGNGDISTPIVVEGMYTADDLLNSEVYNDNYAPTQSEFEITNTETFHSTSIANSNTIILESTTAISYGIAIKWSDNTLVTTEGSSTEITINRRDSATSEEETPKRESCSYSQHDDLMTLLSDPFNTTKNTKPVYTIQENFVDIYADNTFFSKFVELKYIRRPKRMNKALSIGCELPEHTHQEIVEMGVKSILEAISDPRYTSQSREVLESE